MTAEAVDLDAVVNAQANEISELKTEIRCLKGSLDHYRMYSNSPAHEYYRILYLEGKVRRQAKAMRDIQKLGWQPSQIIREYDWEPRERKDSQRRPKLRPMIIITEED